MPTSRNAPGTYRSKFKVQVTTGTPDGFGHLTGDATTTEHEIWAHIKSLNGALTQFADKSFSQQQHDIEMRYRADIGVGSILNELNGPKRSFRVINGNDIDGRHEKLILRCVEAH